jgi:GxxExxY protein
MLARLQRAHRGAFQQITSTSYVPLAPLAFTPPPFVQSSDTSDTSDTIGNTQGTSTENYDLFPRIPTTSLIPYAENVHDAVVQMSKNVHSCFGPNCSESLYQRAVLRAAYLHHFPAMQEREIFTDYGQGSLLVGRVDLEVASCCLYEFKVCKVNLEDHPGQMKRYLRAYDNNNEKIRVAALLYFTKTGVFVHRVR